VAYDRSIVLDYVIKVSGVRQVYCTRLCNKGQWRTTGQLFSLYIAVSSNITDLHDIIKILLKVTLNSRKSTFKNHRNQNKLTRRNKKQQHNYRNFNRKKISLFVHKNMKINKKMIQQ
jgi:hypothetical protein